MKLNLKLTLIGAMIFSFVAVHAQSEELFVNNALGECTYDLEVMAVPNSMSCSPVHVSALDYTISEDEEKTFTLTELQNEMGEDYRYEGVKVYTANKTIYMFHRFCGSGTFDDDDTGDCGGELVEVYLYNWTTELMSVDISDQQ